MSKINGKVVQTILESREKRSFVVVKLDDGIRFDFPVPTIQEIRDKFFFKKAKTQPGIPARPPNKFFIFRTILQSAIYKLKLRVPIVSGLASEVWKKCTPEIIELFTKLSNIAKIEHGQINPGYVYRPNRKSPATKNQINPGASISPTYSPTAPIWTASSRANSFLRQESRSSIPLAFQTNTTVSSQYKYATSTHYMPPRERTHSHHQHIRHPSIGQFNAFRNPNNSYGHNVNVISRSLPAPTMVVKSMKSKDIWSVNKNDSVPSKEPNLTGQSSDQYKISRDLYPEREDKTPIVIQKMENE